MRDTSRRTEVWCRRGVFGSKDKATAGAIALPVGKIASGVAKMRARIDEPHFLLAEPGKLRVNV